jgi:Eco57I restriction-modification methylase
VRTLLSKLDLDALADGESRGIDGLDLFIRKGLGWTSGLRKLSVPDSRKVSLLELAIADEPATLMAFAAAKFGERLTSLGYTRQARYALSWSNEGVVLYDTLRWARRPGDLPLLTAAMEDRAAIGELLELLHRDNILEEVPSDLLAPDGEHEALPELLGGALRKLRLQVADAEAYSGRDPARRDTAVLRLFHQILYVRVMEDRRRALSRLKVRDLLESDRLGTDLENLLADYCKAANSELFEPAGIAIDALPGASLRGVLRQTVEPWERLRLDFSVARADLAGRLYESYLAALPVEDIGALGRSQRLFPLARGVDQREKQATFYTPPALARLLTERTLSGWLRGRPPCSPQDIRVVDPACGSGAFLIAAYDWLRGYFEASRGRPLRTSEREELLVQCIFGADIDERALGLAQVQLLEVANLRGRLPSLRDTLYCGDSLPAPPTAAAQRGQVPWEAILKQHGAFTTVLGNPPFGAQAKLPLRLSIERVSELVEQYPEVRSFGQDYAYFFLALGLRLLADDGSAGLVMPRALVGLEQGAAARRSLLDAGISWVADLRAAKVFPHVAASVAAVVLDRRGTSTTCIETLADSRGNPRAILDDLASGSASTIVRSSVARKRLISLVDTGWTSFRVRWASELRGELERPTRPLAPAQGGGPRDVRTGVKTARVADFVIEPGDYRDDGTGAIFLRDRSVPGRERAIPRRFLPRLVEASDLTPFDLHDSGRRVLLPFERDGQPGQDPALEAELKARGGLPPHYQRGYLPTLLGPKVLLRAVAREPAAVADPKGQYVPKMRGAHALRFDDIPVQLLAGIAALLNSAFYQWLLRGLGSPRADESIEVTLADVRCIPLPDLTELELRQLHKRAQAIVEALSKPDPIDRALTVRDLRSELDAHVFDLIGASQRLRQIVTDELIRVA